MASPELTIRDFKLVLVTNELPEIVGVDEAIWRRIKLIPFRVTFPEHRRDPDLKDKLLEERDGILNFLIECHGEYEAARGKHPSGLVEPDAVKNELRDYRACSDTVGMFLAECCESRREGFHHDPPPLSGVRILVPRQRDRAFVVAIVRKVLRQKEPPAAQDGERQRLERSCVEG